MRLLWRTLFIFKGMQERPPFEATCVRLWAHGIQDQIMDETQQIQTWISQMTGELNRLRRVQPAWVQQLQTSASRQPPQQSIAPSPSAAPVPSQAPAQSTSSNPAPGIPVKAAPASKNPSMSSVPRNAFFPNVQGADPWAGHKPRSQ